MNDQEIRPSDGDADERAPYDPPAISVVGTVAETTLGPFELGADGAGGFQS